MKLYIKKTTKEEDKLNKKNGYRKDVYLYNNNDLYQLTCITINKLSKLSQDVMSKEIINIIEDNIFIVRKFKQNNIIKALKSLIKKGQADAFRKSKANINSLRKDEFNEFEI